MGGRRDKSAGTRRGRSIPRTSFLLDGGIDLLGRALRIVGQSVALEPVQERFIPRAGRVGASELP